MLSFFTRNRMRALSRLHGVRLRLEQLECRDCPAPVLIGVSARLIGGTMIVTGQVQDTNPTSDLVTISGAASGKARFLDSQGDFEFIISNVTSSGWIQIRSLKPMTGSGNGGSFDLQNYLVIAPIGSVAPYITITGISYGHERSINISGEVIALNPAGLPVQISGAASGTTTTDANGNFNITLTASGLGTVSAQTVANGLTSNVVTEAFSASPPVIDQLGYVEGPGNSFVIRGHVSCADPEGLIVSFGGQVAAVEGLTAVVGPDGWFEIEVTITPGDNGTISAQTTDWWGQESNVATDQLNHSN